MTKVTQIAVPEGSLLAGYGDESDYRDCFVREAPNTDGEEMGLDQFLERFYSSRAFLPERLVLMALGKPASIADVQALARGDTDHFGVWQMARRIERSSSEAVAHTKRSSSEAVARPQAQALLTSKPTGTASWFAVEAADAGTRLYFGSWVGSIEDSGWNALLKAHLWYARKLLASV